MRHKCLASFIVFVLFFTISFLITFIQLKTVLTSDFVLRTLEDSKIYNNLSKIADGIFSESSDDPKTPIETKILIKLVSQTVNPALIQNEVEKNVPLLFSYLESQTSNLDITFNLSSFKNEFKIKSPQVLPSIINKEVETLRTCPEDFEYQQGVFPSCIPPTMTKQQLSDELIKSFNVDVFLNEIPDTYNLSDLVKNNNAFLNARLVFQIINYGLWISLILTIILLGCLILLGRHYWPSIPRWVGLSLVLPSGFALLSDLIGSNISKLGLSQINSEANAQTLEILQPIMDAISKNSFQASLLFSAVIFGVGAILIILSYAIPHPPEPKPALSNPQPQGVQK